MTGNVITLSNGLQVVLRERNDQIIEIEACMPNGSIQILAELREDGTLTIQPLYSEALINAFHSNRLKVYDVCDGERVRLSPPASAGA